MSSVARDIEISAQTTQQNEQYRAADDQNDGIQPDLSHNARNTSPVITSEEPTRCF
jgi:hypothetical protein